LKNKEEFRIVKRPGQIKEDILIGNTCMIMITSLSNLMWSKLFSFFRKLLSKSILYFNL